MPRDTDVMIFAGEVVDQIRDFTPALEVGQTVASATIAFITAAPAQITLSSPVTATPNVSWRTTTTTTLAVGIYDAILLATTNTGEIIGHAIRYRVQRPRT